MKGFGLQNQLQTAKAAMARRKKELLAEEEALISQVFEMTREARLEAVRKSR